MYKCIIKFCKVESKTSTKIIKSNEMRTIQ